MPTGLEPASSGLPDAGVRPPQQARSRAALEKLLSAAESVLVDDGLDLFTIAAVAHRSEASVGAIYRRFGSKEDLLAAVKDRMLTRIERQIAQEVGAADPHLASIVDAFAHTVAGAFMVESPIIPALLAGGNAGAHERGFIALQTIQNIALNAAAPHFAEVARADPLTAVVFVVRSILGACIHRTTSVERWPDGLTWQQWADNQTEMATQYLLMPRRHPDTGCESATGPAGADLPRPI